MKSTIRYLMELAHDLDTDVITECLMVIDTANGKFRGSEVRDFIEVSTT